MLKGGVIMDVVNPNRPRSPKTPAPCDHDPRARHRTFAKASVADVRPGDDQGIPGLFDPDGRARIGHFAEAIESLGGTTSAVEVLPADEAHHIDKFAFDVPSCGATNLGALRRSARAA